jgi:hypothetical protein
MSKFFLSVALLLVFVSISYSLPANRVPMGFELEQLITSNMKDAGKSATCTACRIIVRGLQFLIEQDAEEEALIDFARYCGNLLRRFPNLFQVMRA